MAPGEPTLSRRSLIRDGGLAVAGTFLPLGAIRLPDRDIRFKKLVLDTRFVAEGVAVADVNRDGRLDILAGNVWYEAPHWTPHEIAPVTLVDPQHAYSNCFNSWAVDLNHDGWVDQLVIGMPGERAIWRENARGYPGPWKEHPVWRSACNESPLLADLLGNGKRVLVMGYDDNYLAWFEPSADPYAEWQCHNVSGPKGAGSQRYTHGLGVGDVNGDGRNEILTTEGYYLAPPDPRSGPWQFVRADLGPACAQMAVFDVNGDHRPDIVTSSAHDRGVWWFEQLQGGGFKRHLIDETVSESHSLVLAKFGRPETVNAVTGKRIWAHPPGVDVGSGEPAWLVRYELKRSRSGVEWVRHVIDEDSGVGTQFVVQDVNHDGLQDIVVANKKGVFLFEQLRG
ncbi:MAG TPA: VCBS repeat-containing protein [Fimbriimonadaceae bacterium]|nr:VCBS repeat-containing protein [Fimbriimonadaceae bacterium]